jgi:hypothetical protein
MAERTIKIGNQDVRMMYCTASETGYENMTGKSVEVFLIRPKYDEDGKQTGFEPPLATLSDYITLAMASIVAAYAAKGQEPPINSNYVLFEATAEEAKLLVDTVAELRAEWYHVPDVVKTNEPKEKEEQSPNQ